MKDFCSWHFVLFSVLKLIPIWYGSLIYVGMDMSGIEVNEKHNSFFELTFGKEFLGTMGNIIVKM